MLKKELIKRSPIRVLEKSIHGGLGRGNLGVFTSRKGVGKTACLVHVSIDYLMRNQKVLHISFADDPHCIKNWYDQVFKEVALAYQLDNVFDNHDQIIRNRLIIHFKEAETSFEHVTKTIDRIAGGTNFSPDCVIVDGLSFYKHTEKDFSQWKQLAQDRNMEIWFSATLHREKLQMDACGVPFPVNRFSDLFSVIIMLNPTHDYIDINLLKDHDSNDLDRLMLKLDTKTLLIANRSV